MYFQYGSYQHDENDVNLTTMVQRRMYSPRNRLAFTRKTLYCMGQFCESGQSAIKTKLDALETAYEDDWKDAGLYHDDGTVSAHFLNNSQSVNGVRVLSLNYPKGDPSEYATGRTYSITLQADFLNIEDQIYWFQEQVQFIGNGGPAWELVPTWDSVPAEVFSARSTPQRIIQTGEAVGLQAPPLIPVPLLPLNYEHTNLRSWRRGSAQKIGRHANLQFPVRYRYVFSSKIPQSFFPRPDYPGR